MAGSSANIQKQHVDLFRKSLLRKNLLRKAASGAAYVPFIGDGDLAIAHYSDRKIYGADLDAQRVETARRRLMGSEIRCANCDNWPFLGVDEVFAVADFDAYANPYKSLAAFWSNANKTKRLVIFGTDGMRYRIKRAKVIRSLPDGAESKPTGQEWRMQYNFWWTKYVLPWLSNLVAPYRITMKQSYLRGTVGMLYWGIVCDAGQ